MGIAMNITMFLHGLVIKVAHGALRTLYNNLGENGQSAKIKDIFRMSLRIFKVDFFPAAKHNPQVSARGAPNTKLVFDSWGNLGDLDKSIQSLELATSSLAARRIVLPPTTVAFNNAVARDFNAPWSANNLNLDTLQSVLYKASLPMDFYEIHLTDVQHVDDMYRWVRDNYDGAKPLHHLALLVSIVAASTLIPNLFTPTKLKHRFDSTSSKEDVRRIFEDIDWIAKDNRGGMSEPAIFIAMITTFIIAIYEENSPLRQHMLTCKRGGLGDAWRDKNSRSFFSFRFYSFLAIDSKPCSL
jgi:hypothetical protein